MKTNSESSDMPDYEWISPRKMVDYYLDQSEGIPESCTARFRF